MNSIEISKDEWIRLNNTLSKDEIKLYISNLIKDNKIPLPYREITIDEAKMDFMKLQQLALDDVIMYDDWITRYDYNTKWFHSPIIFKSVNIGNKSSDFFHQVNRWKCDSINAPSPERTWNEERFRLTLLNALWTLKVEEVNSKILRMCIALRKYISSQFRPSTAKTIIELFGAKSILDFSAGWGDRLSGFLASNAFKYYGIDPNSNVHNGYKQQIKTFSTPEKTIVLYDDCAENVIIDDEVDLIFTSPPYFNIERYTHDSKQSFKRYKNVNSWLNNFLFKAIDNAWKKLKIGGYMVINISDVYSNHTINKLCDPMNDYIALYGNSKYIGSYGYQMAKRPNSGALVGKNGVFCEPMWIWKKEV